MDRGFRIIDRLPVEAWPAQILDGIYFHNLPFPVGTTGNAVFPTFDTTHLPESTRSWNVQAEALQIDFPCETYKLESGETVEFRGDTAFRGDIRTHDCHVKDVLISYKDSTDVLLSNMAGHWGLIDIIDCDSKYHIWPEETGREMPDAWKNASDPRILFSLTKRATPDGDPSTIETIHPDNVTIAVCKPSHQIQTVQIHSTMIPGSKPKMTPLPPELGQPKKQYHRSFNGLLAYVVFGSMQHWLRIRRRNYVENFGIKEPGWMRFMALKERLDRNVTGKDPIGALSNPEVLGHHATETFTAVAAQYLNHVFMGPTTRKVTGQVTISENRLYVSKDSAIFLSVFFILMTVVTIAIIFLRPLSATSCHPPQVLFTAAASTHNLRLMDNLTQSGTTQAIDAKIQMDSYRFRTVMRRGTAIGAPMQLPTPINLGMDKLLRENVPSWWHPITSTDWFLKILVLFPISAIILLEVLQRISNKNQGLMDLEANRTTTVTTYISAAVSLCVPIGYSSLEYMVALSASLDYMQACKAVGSESIGLGFTRKLLPRAFNPLLQSRHIAVNAALTSFFAGFLMIVMSGLYTSVEFPRIAQLQLIQQDTFTVNKSLIITYSDEAMSRAPLLEYADMEYNRYIHQDLVFNHWEEPNGFRDTSSGGSILKARLPATRARLNCTPISISDHQHDLVVRTFGGWLETVDVTYSLHAKDWCETPPPGNSTSESVKYPFTLTVPSLETGGSAVVGKIVPLRWHYNVGIDVMQLAQCPSIIAIAGKIWLEGQNGRDQKVKSDLAALLCYQNVVQVEADVSLMIPDLTFDPSQRPLTDESFVDLLRAESGSHRLDLDLDSWIGGNAFEGPVYGSALPNTHVERSNVDKLFRALVDGRHGRPFEELAGEANTQNFAMALSKAYGRYMAPHISQSLRNNKKSDPALIPNSRNSTVALAGNMRLQQNDSTKIAVQAMFSGMASCALFAQVLMPAHEVFQYNPCLIFGTAMLLAGSYLADSSPLLSNLRDAGGR